MLKKYSNQALTFDEYRNVQMYPQINTICKSVSN